MAPDALHGRKMGIPFVDVARRVEVVDRGEECDEIAHFSGVHMWRFDAQLPHLVHHLGEMIPERSG
jgi:hypothetical protein